MEYQDLTDKVVIITGASSGIGAATARVLAAQGAITVLTGRSAERLARVAADLDAERCLVMPLDVADGPQVVKLVERTVERFGRVDVLFANAAQYISGTVLDGDPDAWASLIDTNVTGVLRCIHAVLPHMVRQRSGDIVVTASISSHREIDQEPIYCASKHAIITFVNILRREVAPKGIRVATLSPGMVLNELWGVTDPAIIAHEVAAHHVLSSEDVAEMVVQMLRMPARITLRDIVMLAQGQII